MVLAGGAARRFPGKLRLTLGAAVAGLRAVLPVVVVVTKDGVELPSAGVPVWIEPAEPRHPLAGVAFALGRARGPVLVCAGDMPSVPPELLRALAVAAGPEPAVVPCHRGGIEPLCALYRPEAAGALLRGAAAGRPARAVVEALRPAWLDWPDASAFRNVNTPPT